MNSNNNMERTALFYMANAHPEIGRMLNYAEKGETIAAEAAQQRALAIVDTILARHDIAPAGREEWRAVKSLLMGYTILDEYARKVLRNFAEPFSYKFMYEYAHGK
ncbi:MAG: hypothetical protein WC764_03890 [Candidatus Paceibacterota bacterium]|jgi:hypothetical protein